MLLPHEKEMRPYKAKPGTVTSECGNDFALVMHARVPLLTANPEVITLITLLKVLLMLMLAVLQSNL